MTSKTLNEDEVEVNCDFKNTGLKAKKGKRPLAVAQTHAGTRGPGDAHCAWGRGWPTLWTVER